jgi:hypothetical protein
MLDIELIRAKEKYSTTSISHKEQNKGKINLKDSMKILLYIIVEFIFKFSFRNINADSS